MKSLPFSDVLKVIKPEYVYLKIKPNNSIRNTNTHLIAGTISTLYKHLFESIKKEEEKVVKLLGKEFGIGTKYSLERQGKIAYYLYMEKQKVEFYFIIPKQHVTIIKERLGDSWDNVTIDEVKEIPKFGEKAITRQMVYQKEDALSLRVDRRDSDLLKSNLNVIDVMEEGDKAAVLYNFIPGSQGSFQHSYRNTLEKIKKGYPVDRKKMGVTYIFKAGMAMLDSVIKDLTETFAGKNKKKEDESILDSFLERLNGGKKTSTATDKKISQSILNTQILVMSESEDTIRRRNNATSLAQSFEVVSEDNKLISKNHRGFQDFHARIIPGAETNKVSDVEAQNFIQLAGRDILERFSFIEKVETQEQKVPQELQTGNMYIGSSTFRGKDTPAYLSADKEFQYLSLILIGPNRAGKSTLIGNLGKDAINHDEVVINFDYIGNCELSDEMSELFSTEKTLDIECNDFNTIQGLGYNEIPVSSDPFEQYANAKKQTTQLTTLINSINTDDTHLSSRMERYLQSAANIVFINGGSINDVFKVLTDHKIRKDFLDRVPVEQYENIGEYMESLEELNEYKDEKEKVKNGNTTTTVTKQKLVGTKYHLISGIMDRLNKLKANPYMEMMLKKDTSNNIDLVEEMQKNQLINIRMPETMFSTDNEKDVYATYWISKIWLALQVRKAKFKGNRDKMKKVNLFIDELYQVENTEKFITSKLSRLPKFNIKPIISCHYLNQIKHIREELRSANASYMLIAGCDKKNFKELESELYPFTEGDLLSMKRYHSLNLIKDKEGYSRFITKLPKPVSIKGKDKTA
ncbi:hypothetical protein HNQ94_000379 [Salirhabdus euzebyi]|uniref:Uncharacterized protein n=1 Tax=Salirhabdus euzebyi TaxID=394506 RepID=A0A841Q2Y8_9BACI|nr:hypothetical protein [Salirhabdus euzebyi]MBB6451958.1 hypothetical protein [Salirhabdus euzebyi]